MNQVTVFHYLWHQSLNLSIGSNDLTFCCSRVIGKVTQLLNLLPCSILGSLLHWFLIDLPCIFRGCLVLFFLVLFVLLLDKGIIYAICLICKTQTFTQFLAFFLTIAGEWMEILLIVLKDNLVQDGFLNLGIFVIPFVDKEYQALDKVLLFIEVLLIFLLCHLEWIHGDWMFLGI